MIPLLSPSKPKPRYPLMTDEEASEQRIKLALAVVTGMENEPVMEVLKKLSGDFSLTSEEIKTVIHRWVKP